MSIILVGHLNDRISYKTLNASILNVFFFVIKLFDKIIVQNCMFVVIEHISFLAYNGVFIQQIIFIIQQQYHRVYGTVNLTITPFSKPMIIVVSVGYC